jgi:DNA-binding IclR family transcriptional regulator
MRTVERALRLLDHLDGRHPEAAVSDPAPRAGLDTADTSLRAGRDPATVGPERARAHGPVLADRTVEAEVIGLAFPLIGASGHASGATAVATPASRSDAALAETIHTALARAADMASLAPGGRPRITAAS